MHYSLLDIISGRKEKRGVTGNVVINGELIPENFRCTSGYVTQVNLCSYIECLLLCTTIMCTQKETVTGTLTVKENIMFSAQLRLPRDMTYDEKKEIVEEVITDLGLQSCAHSRVCITIIQFYCGTSLIYNRLGLRNSEAFLVEKGSVRPLEWS